MFSLLNHPLISIVSMR